MQKYTGIKNCSDCVLSNHGCITSFVVAIFIMTWSGALAIDVGYFTLSTSEVWFNIDIEGLLRETIPWKPPIRWCDFLILWMAMFVRAIEDYLGKFCRCEQLFKIGYSGIVPLSYSMKLRPPVATELRLQLKTTISLISNIEIIFFPGFRCQILHPQVLLRGTIFSSIHFD